MIKNQKLTRHFTLFEAATTRRVAYQEENKEYMMSRLPVTLLTLQLLEKARNALQWPIRITSLGRSPGLNVDVGGSNSSQHVRCEAVDWVQFGRDGEHAVQHAASVVAKKFLDDCVMFGQLILEKRNTPEGTRNWIHMSIGYPLRPLYKCRQVASIVDGKFELAYQMDLDPWR